ncbi:MAG: hypothetical protein K0S55_1532, partial [Clostridia bacterium]|nr:hypothetical protein [Clostridia bacterium]
MKYRNIGKIFAVIIIQLIFSIILSSCSSADLKNIFPDILNNIADEEINVEAQPEEEYTPPVHFSLALYTGEVLNPYTSQNRANHELTELCYDALIILDNSYKAIPVIAEKYVVSENKIIVYLRQDVLFSDNTPVTAVDCLYSFQKASEADSIYNSRFKYISDWSVVSDYVFEINFFNNNVYNINLLDIPIIKKDSYALKSGALELPTGSGRYYPVKDGDNFKLKNNENSIYKDKGDFKISEIDINKISDTESLTYNFNYGIIHALYVDLSDGNTRFRGNIELVSFGSNSMVFAVVNTTKPYFQSPEASQGITYIINRSNISENILMNNINTVWYPLNPSWEKTKNANLNNDIYSTATGHEYFNQAGLKLSGINRSWNDEPLDLNIIVNQEDIIKVKVANSIADDLKGMGFNASVNSLKWDDYLKAVANGEFDIYIGEAKIPYNMDISSLLSPSICNNGLEYSDEFLQAINDFNNGELDVRSFIHIFQSNLPFIPLYFSSSALAI